MRPDCGRRGAAVFIVLAIGASGCMPAPLLEPVPDGGEGGGASGGGGAPPDDKTPPAATAIGAGVFAEDQVLQIHLNLSEQDRYALEEHGDEERYVPAEAVVVSDALGRLELGTIGLRHKGAYTLHSCWRSGRRSREGACARLSYKLELDEYVDGQRLDGLKELNLHASSGDETRQREWLAYSTFRDFGVDAPRTALAEVHVNGELEGVFIAVESIDGRFTKSRHPGAGDGNLYKEIWPSVHLNPDTLLDALRTNEELGDVSGFMAFTEAVGRATPASLASELGAWVDVEQLLRYVAVDRALRNWDGIMAFYERAKPHNFYWYHDAEGSGRFELIPWDMDNTLWESDPYMEPSGSAPPVPDWNQEPRDCERRPVWDANGSQGIYPPRCDHLLDLLAEAEFGRFQALAAELLEGPFAADRLVAKATHLAERLDPLIAADPLLDHRSWRTRRLNFEYVLRRSSDDFRAFAAQGLTEE